jgi:hypothetical protein
MSEFIDGLVTMIDARVQVLDDEIASLRYARAALRPTPELPSARKARDVGGVEFEEEPRAGARRPTLTVETVRDYVQTLHRPFSAMVVREHFGCSDTTARRLVRVLADRGTIQRPEGSPANGRYSVWEFVKPNGVRLKVQTVGGPSPLEMKDRAVRHVTQEG